MSYYSHACLCTGRCRIPPYTCTGNAPNANPWWSGPTVFPASIMQGCICPPTSEKTCESRICPRKDQFKHAQSEMQAAMERAQKAQKAQKES